MRNDRNEVPVFLHFFLGILVCVLSYFVYRSVPNLIPMTFVLTGLTSCLILFSWLRISCLPSNSWLVKMVPFLLSCLPSNSWLVKMVPFLHQIKVWQENRPRRIAEEGNWLDAPIAEVDKSTIGKLLASRMRREPGLHVVVRGRDSSPEPFRQDALYDAELDG
jgi:hypothetical protein